jgi:vesicle-associated membrane protein 7
MSLIYAIVAKGGIILAEHANSSGNFTAITHAILEKINPQVESRLTYVYDRFVTILVGHQFSNLFIVDICFTTYVRME